MGKGENIVRRFALPALVQAVLALAVLAVPATAATTHIYVGQIGGNGSAPGNFSNNQGIAIDPSSGDLFVADQGNSRVQEVTTSGDPVAQWNELSSGVAGIAVDAANDRVYVTEQGSNAVAVGLKSPGHVPPVVAEPVPTRTLSVRYWSSWFVELAFAP